MAVEPLAMCYPALAGGTLRGRPPPRFRTIQVCPKDWPARLLQAEDAVVRPGRWSHGRLEAPRVHHDARRRGPRRGGLASAHLVLNFRNPAPPSPRGVLTNATPRRFPLRLITRNLSSGM